MCYHKTIKEMPPMNGWLYFLITVVTETLPRAVTSVFYYYPSVRQCIRARSRSSRSLRLPATHLQLSSFKPSFHKIHCGTAVYSFRRDTGPSVESQPSTVMMTPREGLYHRLQIMKTDSVDVLFFRKEEARSIYSYLGKNKVYRLKTSNLLDK